MKSNKISQRLPVAVRVELREAGVLIRGARLKRRWTQKDLAERAGISIATLQRLEQGNFNVSFSVVSMICWLLDIPWKLSLDISEIEYLKAIAQDKKRARLSSGEHLDNQF